MINRNHIVRPGLSLLFMALGLVCLFSAGRAQPVFERVTEEQHLTKTYSDIAAFGGGVSFIDFDQDGWDDITMTTDSLSPLYFFKNHYGHFEQYPMGINQYSDARSVFWVDYDHDGDLDLLVIMRETGVKLYRNNGNLNMQDVTVASGLNSLGGTYREGCGIGDFNNDGLLDFYMCSYELENTMLFQKPDHSFQNVTSLSQTADSTRSTFQAIVLDANQDGWQDLYLSNDYFHGNTFYLNLGDSTFEEISTSNGTFLEFFSMGQCLGDYDNDLDLDIYLTDRFYQSRLLRNDSNTGYTEVGQSAGVDYASGFGWGCVFFDADFDGDQDLYVSGIMMSIVGGEPSLMYVNQGDGTFTQDTLPGDSLFSFSSALGDFDNDFKEDIVVLNADGNYLSLWHNQFPNPVQAISIELEGCSSNEFGVGAEIHVFDDGTNTAYAFHAFESFLGQHSQRRRIPVYSTSSIDSLKVLWPNGNVTVLHDVLPNQRLVISECDTARPDAVILVPDYKENELTLCGDDSILLVSAGQYESVTWSTEDTTDSIFAQTPGTYELFVVNQFGQSDSAVPLQLNFQATPAPDVWITSDECAGNNSIVLTPTDTSILHSFMWSTGSSSSTLTNLSAGTYTVTITYNGHCPKTDSFTIISNDTTPSISVLAVTTPPICHGASNGQISLSLNGGIGPLDLLWDDGSTEVDRTLGAGEYSFTVTDSIGCSFDSTIFLGQPQAYEVFVLSTPDTSLLGRGTASVSVSGATPPYEYLWSDPLAQSSPTAIHLDSGDYEVWIHDVLYCDTVVQLSIGNYDAVGLAEVGPRKGMTCVSNGTSLTAWIEGPMRHGNKISVIDLQGRSIDYDAHWLGENVIQVTSATPGQYLFEMEGIGSCRWVQLERR